MLHNVEPFRHALLHARQKDPLLSHIFVPMLEEELINGSRTNFYLEQLEKIFRQKAYEKYLEKRVETKDDNLLEDVDAAHLEIVDLETVRRRQ
jgi:hypothetical protein